LRSVSIPWSVALHESERLLDDLSRYTKVDGIELLDFFPRQDPVGHGPASGPAPRVLPSKRGLDLDLPLVRRDEFKAALRFMGEAKSRGFKVTCNLAPLWLGSDKLRGSSLMDVTGRRLSGPAGFPVYGCPNDPNVRRYGEFVIRQLVCNWPDMDILAFDHLEYPHMLLRAHPKFDIESTLSCFCPACDEAALKQGFDLGRMLNSAKLFLAYLSRGVSPGKTGAPPSVNADDVANFFVRWPRLAEWLSFRMDSMTEYCRLLLEAGRDAARTCNPKLQFGLEFQLPSMSQIMGTDFLTLSFNLDILMPKFSDHLPGSAIPLFAQEVASRTGADRDSLVRMIRDAFDLGPGPKRYTPCLPSGGLTHLLLYSNAFDSSVVARQMKYLKTLVGKVPIQPCIWESCNDNEGLRRKIEALSSAGFDGFLLGSWPEGVTSEHLRALKGIL